MAYRRILARPHVFALCATSVLARLPVGMGSVALVIFLHDRTGSFGVAGLAAGAYTIGLGATSPLLGRLVDRRGPRPVLIPAAALAAVALVGVVLLAEAGAGTAPIVLAAAVAGCSTPPVGGLLRQLWPAPGRGWRPRQRLRDRLAPDRGLLRRRAAADRVARRDGGTG